MKKFRKEKIEGKNLFFKIPLCSEKHKCLKGKENQCSFLLRSEIPRA